MNTTKEQDRYEEKLNGALEWMRQNNITPLLERPLKKKRKRKSVYERAKNAQATG